MRFTAIVHYGVNYSLKGTIVSRESALGRSGTITKQSPLSTTSYTLLGLLAIKPWTTYELAKQMERTIRRFWPRARSKVYEEPKNLVSHGLARATADAVGQRTRTIYSITPKGRRTFAAWLATPGEPPVLEWEQLVKVFFAEHGTKADLLAQLEQIRQWADARDAEDAMFNMEFLQTGGPFPQRAAQIVLFGRFMSDWHTMIASWARWATTVVEPWPDDISCAEPDLDAIRDLVTRRIARTAAPGDT
jgi:PadR family transcriptional regulator AphA